MPNFIHIRPLLQGYNVMAAMELPVLDLMMTDKISTKVDGTVFLLAPYIRI